MLHEQVAHLAQFVAHCLDVIPVEAGLRVAKQPVQACHAARGHWPCTQQLADFEQFVCERRSDAALDPSAEPS
jgi:hypothetical protein